MKKLMLATSAVAMMAGAAAADGHANEVKIGVILGFTGPLESIPPAMGAGAELAMAEVTESSALLDGATVTSVRGDSTCIDAGAATAAAERLVTSDNVDAIMGADCSGVTGAILQNVARPNGVVMISPSATSPGLSTADRKSVVSGKSVDLGGPRIIKKKNTNVPVSNTFQKFQLFLYPSSFALFLFHVVFSSFDVM